MVAPSPAGGELLAMTCQTAPPASKLDPPAGHGLLTGERVSSSIELNFPAGPVVSFVRQIGNRSQTDGFREPPHT